MTYIHYPRTEITTGTPDEPAPLQSVVPDVQDIDDDACHFNKSLEEVLLFGGDAIELLRDPTTDADLRRALLRELAIAFYTIGDYAGDSSLYIDDVDAASSYTHHDVVEALDTPASSFWRTVKSIFTQKIHNG